MLAGRAKRTRIPSSRGLEAAQQDASPPPERPRSQRRAAKKVFERQESAGSDSSGAAKEESDGEEEVEGQEKKARFVWTPDLHQRFVTAVHRLGVAQAKPQAIRQLMGCDTEDEPPTRQNIKSHLQKYRLLVQKQQAQKQGQNSSHRAGGGSGGSHVSVAPSHVASVNPARTASPTGARGGANGGDGSGGSSGSSSVASPRCGGGTVSSASASSSSIERLRQQVQVGLMAQLEVQSKLHEQMVEQRRTQASLGWRIMQAGPNTTLQRPQLERIAQHVLMQRMMLQHLCSMLHATTVDLAHDQMAQEFKPDEQPSADVFDGVGLDGDGAIPQFPFDLPEQPDGAAEPLNQSFDYSHIEVRETHTRARTRTHTHTTPPLPISLRYFRACRPSSHSRTTRRLTGCHLLEISRASLQVGTTPLQTDAVMPVDTPTA